MDIIGWVKARLTETTTWAGTGIIAMMLGQYLGPAEVQAILTLGTAAVGAYMVFFKEKK